MLDPSHPDYFVTDKHGDRWTAAVLDKALMQYGIATIFFALLAVAVFIGDQHVEGAYFMALGVAIPLSGLAVIVCAGRWIELFRLLHELHRNRDYHATDIGRAAALKTASPLSQQPHGHTHDEGGI